MEISEERTTTRDGLTVKIVPMNAINGKSSEPKTKEQKPADGGVRAWLVCAGSFLCNGILFGIINTYGVIYAYLTKHSKDENSDTKASLVGSLAIGSTFVVSVLAGVMTDNFGIRRTAFLGASLSALGLFVASFCVHNFPGLYASYGLMFGIGASLIYTPSLVILGHYFKHRLGLANGIVTAGSSVFTIALPYFLEYLIEDIDLKYTFIVLSAIIGFLMIVVCVFKPVITEKGNATHIRGPPCCPNASWVAKIINVNNWKNKRYVVWCLSIPMALFGYFVPYVHLIKYVEENLPSSDGKVLMMCIGATSGIGRILTGFISDLPKVNGIVLQQISFISIGILTMLITVANDFSYLIAIACFLGIFDGCFISLIGPIAFKLCGASGASQAIGTLLAFCSVPLTFGPPVAALLRHYTGSYTASFIAAGCSPIIGAILMSLMHCLKQKDNPQYHYTKANGGVMETSANDVTVNSEKSLSQSQTLDTQNNVNN